MEKKMVPQEHGETINEKQKKQELEILKQHQEQVLTLQRMKEIEKEIEQMEVQEKKLQDIIKVDGVELSSQVKIQKAYLAQLGKEDDFSYLLYTDQELIGKSNETGMIVLTPEYINARNQQLAIYEERFGDNYLIDVDQELDPLAIQENSEELVYKSELERIPEIEKEAEAPEEKRDRQNEDTVHNIEDDLGMHIVSLVRIEDENFSEEVIGRQTGYKEQYVALTDHNTFHLIGENPNGKYELNPDFLGATTAETNEQPEYDENGNCCGSSYTDLVMRRSDGTRSNLAIDLNYGQIGLYNRETNEEIRTSTCKPTEQEIEEAREADEKGRTIAEQEKYVDQLAEKVNRGEESVETLEAERKKLEERKEEEEDPYYESWVEEQHRKGNM